jgi:acetyltransferase
VGGLGHTVLFGLGGVLVEVMKDVTLSLAPVTSGEAVRMVRGLRGVALLQGARGRPGVDLCRVEELICRVSRLVIDCPAVVELDLNPVIARPRGEPTLAVDVRIRIAGRESA